MCGIAGLYRPAADSTADGLKTSVLAMTSVLRHRGPDGSGTWIDPATGIALGHRRLSIIDLSPNGHQPMVSESGRRVITFNGEIYNFGELRRELLGCGHQFRGHSDTEVLLAAVEEWGLLNALKRSIGMFAMAIWDRQERSLYLARDRLGEKPLYYGWVDGTLLFGSELKALRAYAGGRLIIDRDALALLLRHNYIPAPYSIYKGIRKLEPGMVLRVDSGSNEERSHYWSLRGLAGQSQVHRFRGSAEEATEGLDRLLRQAIRGQMVADVPLGAFLSGGIDSSTVVALMQAQSERPVKTFTIGFEDQNYDEAKHAKTVAAHLGTDHTEWYVTPGDALAVIPHLPSLYDEPFSDASQIPTSLVARLARRSVTVSLSGDGGDELFAGYNRYFLARTIWERVRRAPHLLRRMAALGLTCWSPRTWDRLFAGVARAIPSILRPRLFGEGIYKLAEILRAPGPEEIYRNLVSHWDDPARVVLNAAEPPTALTDPERWADLGDYTERMMFLDSVSYLPDDILVKIDRASMGVSLESRVPLLDPRVVEFAWSLPLELKIRKGQGKWLLRQVLYRYVPPHLVDRPKMGFGVPIDSWLRGPLREWGEAMLDEARIRQDGFFDHIPIRRRWEEHLSGRRNWQYPLWDVLMFQGWLDAERLHSIGHASLAANAS
ncbi:asparagine synthase [Sulfurifustis variabilis]|uniref:asparagine synthase (glutamine-hydrolyzing) n=1 Tax=Sulfurifustis variabilis TaxID=1675686 RepID=A0A1B4VDR6_9GAMM|nr:asparagine synthase (glutamine-hydrolyzing) [Sulfurifustis variabilis]BAU48597.1 asparagine synthase [Sulfurifustis variabilis]